MVEKLPGPRLARAARRRLFGPKDAACRRRLYPPAGWHRFGVLRFEVEHYLRDAGTIPKFCASVASLPTDATSVFIRPGNVQQFQQVNAPAVRGRTMPTTPEVTGGRGTYQVGIVVPVNGGCG